MFLRTNLILIVFLFFSCITRVENLALPSVFSDYMVLQRETEVSFWGKSSPNEKIEIRGSWGKSSSVKADTSGKWELNLATPSAGGPYEVVVNDSKNSI
ncbi:MAG: 9-O-acetylesterase, partial [Flavobacteriaceae bacterium]